MNQTLMLAAAAFMGAFMAAEYKESGTSAAFWLLLVLSAALVALIVRRTHQRARLEAKLANRAQEAEGGANKSGA